MDFTFLVEHMLFNGISKEQFSDILLSLHANHQHFKKDATIIQEGATTSYLGIVLSGSVTIERIDYLGSRHILSYVGKGELFAEIYALLDNAPLMVNVQANEDCSILFLDISRLQENTLKEHSWYSQLLLNLLLIVSQKNLQLSSRSFHTSPKHIRDRVLSYLSAQSRQHHSQDFDIPFSRQQMADYLNLDRSALSAELSRMQQDGLIHYRKNHFCLLTNHPV